MSQAQAGPPIDSTHNARIPKPGMANSVRNDQPVSGDQAEAVEQVKLVVSELERLVTVIAKAGDRLTALEAERPDDGPAQVSAIWEAAAERFRRFLDQPVQLKANDSPARLEATVPELRHWLMTFADNALGPGGEGLHESAERLGVFERKLGNVEPAIELLLRSGQDLLAEHGLDVAQLQRQAVKAAALATRDDARQAGLAAVAADLGGIWQRQGEELAARVTALRAGLEGLAAAELTPAIAAQRNHALGELAAVPVSDYQRRLADIHEWLDRFAADPQFTRETVTRRIQDELAPLGQQIRQALDRLAERSAPAKLREADTKARRAVTETATAELRRLVAKAHERLEALLVLRRRKLGSQPDERFFGAVAKEVNDAIAELGAIENELDARIVNCEVRIVNRNGGPLNSQFTIHNSSLETRLGDLLKATAQFADSTALEQYLASRWQRELGALADAVVTARTTASRLESVSQQHTDAPGLSQALRDELGSALRRLHRSAELAEATIKEHEQREVPSQALRQTVGERLAALQSALAASQPLLDPTTLALRLKHGQEEVTAERAAATHAARTHRARLATTLPERLGGLKSLARTHRHRLERLLDYGRQLERYDPNLASQLYNQLESLLLVDLDGTLLGTVSLKSLLLGDWLERLTPGSGADDEQVHELDVTMSLLEVALGRAGRVGETLDHLDELRLAHPISRYETKRQQALAQVRQELARQQDRLTQLKAQLEAGSLPELELERTKLAPAGSNLLPVTDTSVSAEQVSRTGEQLRGLLGQQPPEPTASHEIAVDEAAETEQAVQVTVNE